MSPGVRHAGNLLDARRNPGLRRQEQRLKARVRIDLQLAFEARQMFLPQEALCEVLLLPPGAGHGEGGGLHVQHFGFVWLAEIYEFAAAVYPRSKSFLHFHEEPAGTFAGITVGETFDRYFVKTAKERKELFEAIDRIFAE
jgi:hypothetical protein